MRRSVDAGGTLLGETDLLENILADVISTKAYDDLYNQQGNEFFRQVLACRNGATFKRVVDMIVSAVETVNEENEGCLSTVNAEQVYWNTIARDSFIIHETDLALAKLAEQQVTLFVASGAAS